MSESYVEVREDGSVRLAGTLAYPEATPTDVLTVQADGSIAAAAMPALHWCTLNWDPQTADPFTAGGTTSGGFPFTAIVAQDSANIFSTQAGGHDGGLDILTSIAGFYILGITANAPSGVTLDAGSGFPRWINLSARIGAGGGGSMGALGFDMLLPVTSQTDAGNIVVTQTSLPGFVAADASLLPFGIPLSAYGLTGTDEITANGINAMTDGIALFMVGT